MGQYLTPPPEGWTKCTFNGGDVLIAMFTLQLGAQVSLTALCTLDGFS